MDYFVKLLNKHAGRDKIVRIIYFSCCLLESLFSGSRFAVRASNFAKTAARTRSFMKFLDNVPMLQWTLSYGFGKVVR